MTVEPCDTEIWYPDVSSSPEFQLLGFDVVRFPLLRQVQAFSPLFSLPLGSR